MTENEKVTTPSSEEAQDEQQYFSSVDGPYTYEKGALKQIDHAK